MVSVSGLKSKYGTQDKMFETVGGPLDVATIDYIHGFQWKKSKKKLNNQ